MRQCIVENKNEPETVGATNNLRGLAANIKFIEEIVTQREKKVKRKYSRDSDDGVSFVKNSFVMHADKKEPLCSPCGHNGISYRCNMVLDCNRHWVHPVQTAGYP